MVEEAGLQSCSSEEYDSRLVERSYKYKDFFIRQAKSYNLSQEEAEDLFHDFLLRLGENYRNNQFESETKLKGFIGLSIKNSFINLHRRSKRYEQVEIQDYHRGTSETQILSDFIQGLSSQLTYSEKLAIQGWANGFSYEEIALILKQPVGTIKSRIHNARIKCKQAKNKL